MLKLARDILTSLRLSTTAKFDVPLRILSQLIRNKLSDISSLLIHQWQNSYLGRIKANMHCRTLISAWLGIILFASSAIGQSLHTKEDAINLVNQAAEFVQTHPRAQALAVFSDPKGPFRDGDLYLYVLDAKDGNLTMLAHGANRGLIGMPQHDILDADGKDFNAETVQVTASKGEGWINYKWPNPVTHKITQKTAFVKLVDGMIIGAGIYN